jgi:hypothetical protein
VESYESVKIEKLNWQQKQNIEGKGQQRVQNIFLGFCV